MPDDNGEKYVTFAALWRVVIGIAGVVLVLAGMVAGANWRQWELHNNQPHAGAAYYRDLQQVTESTRREFAHLLARLDRIENKLDRLADGQTRPRTNADGD